MKKTKVLFSAIIILSAFLFLPSLSPTVHAATGTVCLIDPSASSCPTSPASLTGTAGTQQRISAFLQGTDVINGADITILADHTILKPVGVDLTGSILPGPQIIEECLSGVLVAGSVCLTTDTLDTLHLAVVAAPGMLSTATTGLLFTAIYNVISPTTGITVGFQTGCSNTSVSPNTCVTITNGTVTPVPETVQTATFSTSTTPNFAVSASPTSLALKRGTQGSSTITLTSVNGFAGTINLSSLVSPSGRHGPTATLTSSSVTLSPGTSGFVGLTISTNKSTATGTYTVTITATSGSTSTSTTISVTITH